MFRVNSMLPLKVIAKNRISLHLTFSSGGLLDTSSHPRALLHQVWRKSVQPFRGSFWHKIAQRIYIWPFITWTLTSVTMATSYFDNTLHFLYTWNISCQFNVFLWSYSQKTISLNLTFDIWPLVPKVCETQGPTSGHLPTKFEENRSSRLGGVFDAKKEHTHKHTHTHTHTDSFWPLPQT